MIMIKQNQDTRIKSNDTLEALSESEIVTENSSSYGSYEVDILTQFKANLSQLDELQSRFKFVLHEVSSLLKK